MYILLVGLVCLSKGDTSVVCFVGVYFFILDFALHCPTPSTL